MNEPCCRKVAGLFVATGGIFGHLTLAMRAGKVFNREYSGDIMAFEARKIIYSQIETERKSKVLAYVTGDRPGMETRISPEVVDLFVDLLDNIGVTKRISLVLHTNGGSTLAAWRIINLVRTFCDELEVIVPLKALSAGTLIAIGADSIMMTKQATLGPIDPSVNNPLNPVVVDGGVQKRVPVSVEAVRGYLDAARTELQIKGDAELTSVLINLSNQIHPLVLGEIFRSRTQIRFLADKLIRNQVKEEEKRKSVIDFLSADSGSHDYTINRREAKDLGLNIDKPSEKFYKVLRALHLEYVGELKLLEPFLPQNVLSKVEANVEVEYSEQRALVEGPAGGCYAFVSAGKLKKIIVPGGPVGQQMGFQDERVFEGWKKLS